VLETRGQLDLLEKALDAVSAGELGANHLHRNRTLVAQVSGEVDGGHPSRADLPLEEVSVCEGTRQHCGTSFMAGESTKTTRLQ
jgi:hypothetical protein